MWGKLAKLQVKIFIFFSPAVYKNNDFKLMLVLTAILIILLCDTYLIFNLSSLLITF